MRHEVVPEFRVCTRGSRQRQAAPGQRVRFVSCICWGSRARRETRRFVVWLRCLLRLLRYVFDPAIIVILRHL